jgi:hypothetical protein
VAPRFWPDALVRALCRERHRWRRGMCGGSARRPMLLAAGTRRGMGSAGGGAVTTATATLSSIPMPQGTPEEARPALPMCTGSARPLFRTPCGCWHVCNPIDRGLARVATGSWSATVSDGGRSCPNFRSHGSALRIPVLPLLIWSASRQPVAPRRKAPYGDETDHVY